MSVLPIRFWPDPCLTKVCAPVDSSDHATRFLVTDLLDTMYAAKGRGLASPQVGVLSRVFVVDVAWKEGAPEPLVFINPSLEASCVDQSTVDEQCLSIPNLPMPVTRPDWIELAWETIEGVSQTARFEGAQARCIQHELDHLNGTVIFDHQTTTDRAVLEDRYAS